MPPRRWTDADLRAAVTAARTWADVLRGLGLRGGGSTRDGVRRRAAELGLDTTHIGASKGGTPRRWTDEQLAGAVAASQNLRQVFLHLGLKVGGDTWISLKRHIVRLELDTSHWDPGAVRPGQPRRREPLPVWTDDDVRDAFEGARSVAEVMRRLDLDPQRKRGRRELERRLTRLGLDPRGVAGQRWAGGRSIPIERRRGRPLEEILVRGSEYRNSSSLKRRLIAEGVLEPRCARCGLTEWLGQPAPLQLDHRNGDRTDNRRENLRLLCPNCHALTDTYCGRNIGR